MATYRQFFVGFWDDPDIEFFTIDEKLLYAFLFTNRATTESGVYNISNKFISERTGINIEKVEIILSSIETKHGKITRDGKTIFVHGFLKNNGRGRPGLLEISILKDVANYPSAKCWGKFLSIYPKHYISIKIKELLNT